jgi:hypothetical protein
VTVRDQEEGALAAGEADGLFIDFMVEGEGHKVAGCPLSCKGLAVVRRRHRAPRGDS